MKRIVSLALILIFSTVISVNLTEVLASHSVTSSLVGGTYNSTQPVALTSTDPSAEIYYTTDGTDPTNSSNLYDGTLSIGSNMTLKFIAVDVNDNHTSAIVTEIFVIDTSPPSVTATPSGGTYEVPQTVTLESNEPATIYYTTDGTDPTNSSNVYSSPIDISSSTTLKFLAIDSAGNTSVIHSEIFLIGPSVIQTEPADGAIRVNSRAVINVTFSVPMDESTINEDTFFITDETNDVTVPGGGITYDTNSNTASFRLVNPNLSFQGGHPYRVTLTTGITDDVSNPLPQDYEFTFTPWFSMVIRLFDNPFSSNFLGGSEFTITPNPLTSSGSLAVSDNGANDADPSDGIMEILDVERGTYVLSQTIVPDGFARIYDNVIYTVHETNPDGPKDIENRDLAISTTDFLATIPAPDLTEEQFNLYNGNATRGFFSGIQDEGQTSIDPIDSVHYIELNPSIVASPSQFAFLDPHLDSILFSTRAQAASSGTQLFDDFRIPNYPAVAEDLATETIYIPSAFVIPYEDSKNNFVLTPVIEKVYPSQTLFMAQPSFVESTLAKFERVNMTFAVEGNNVGFSFGITDTRPPGTPDPGFTVTALFMDVGFVGDVDFSDPGSFQSTPRIDILVDKTIPGFDELPEGCTDFVMLLFDEDQNKWVELQKLRTPTLDSGAETPDDPSDDRCGFTLLPEHFSKFAVGGVKGQTISTEESTEVNDRHGGGGGRSRSTAVTQTPTGSDVETSINTKSGEVVVQFEHVEEGSGQLKIEANELSVFEEFFEDIVFLQDDAQHGMLSVDGKTYATVGEVFDIDASSVKYSGKVDVTIPYDEEAANSIGSESDIRFVHYNEQFGIWEDVTTGVDGIANTVTGTLDSFSPVTAAIVIGNGDNADNSLIEIPQQLDITQPEISISQSEVLISTELSNPATANQDFVMIVQVQDTQGIVQQIRWQVGFLPASKADLISMSLNSLNAGDYTIKVIVVNNMEDPWLLSYSETGFAV